MTLVWLMTLRSEIVASLVKISSCTPSAKKALSGSPLRFSNGNTAILFSDFAGFEVDPAVVRWMRSEGKTKNAAALTTRIAVAARAITARCASPAPSASRRGGTGPVFTPLERIGQRACRWQDVTPTPAARNLKIRILKFETASKKLKRTHLYSR